jgi:hypothetical protein
MSSGTGGDGAEAVPLLMQSSFTAQLRRGYIA